jgi:hypothetical protein
MKANSAANIFSTKPVASAVACCALFIVTSLPAAKRVSKPNLADKFDGAEHPFGFVADRSAPDLIAAQLKVLELVQSAFDELAFRERSAAADRVPARHQELLLLPVGFEVERRDDPVPD